MGANPQAEPSLGKLGEREQSQVAVLEACLRCVLLGEVQRLGPGNLGQLRPAEWCSGSSVIVSLQT